MYWSVMLMGHAMIVHDWQWIRGWQMRWGVPYYMHTTHRCYTFPRNWSCTITSTCGTIHWTMLSPTLMSTTHSNHIVTGLVSTTTHTFLQLMTMTGTTKVKLKECTFTLHAKPIKSLLWCDRQRRAKRNKPAKLNGIVVTNSIEVFHELWPKLTWQRDWCVVVWWC